MAALAAASPFNLVTRDVPTSFQWTSTGPLITAPDDGSGIAAFKDPSVVFYEGAYHVFASTASTAGYNLAYMSFTDFSQADAAQVFYLEDSAIGTGYRAAPQVFYFEPDGLWYLVYQNGNAAYSTNPDISDPSGWTAPTNFYSSKPAIIDQTMGSAGNWVDMWVICDDALCHLFSSDDLGQLYRSQTALADFPAGFDSQTVIALQDADANRLFEAANVYRTGDSGYLLLVEAIGSDGARYFRSWTSGSIGGEWTPLAAEETTPFARSNNVDFEGAAWTQSISHGEVVRRSVDQTLTIDACDMQYLYQGLDPQAEDEYDALPWELGLLTLTSSC